MCFCVIVAYGPDSSTSINLVYVPSHLYYILFELFKVLSLIYYLLCMYVTCGIDYFVIFFLVEQLIRLI